MLGTAPGLLSLLSEKNPKFQVHGLNCLHLIVETEWPQIADQMAKIEELANSVQFKAHRVAALLASKTYYHLGDLDQAVYYALKAEGEFDPKREDEFTARVVSQAIGNYVKEINNPKEKTNFSLSLRHLMESVLNNLLEKERYSECLCLAIETKFHEIVAEVLKHKPELTSDAIKFALSTVGDVKYREELLKALVAGKNPDNLQACQLYHALKQPDQVALLLNALMKSNISDNCLMAYQIAFEMAENASQKFRREVINRLDPDIRDLPDILKRNKVLALYLKFLFEQNRADNIQILATLMGSMDASKMLVGSSVLIAYSYMFAGTGDDNFYRHNVQSLSQSKKWALFTTIAGVGATHIGHLQAAMNVLKPYLDSTSQGPPEHAFSGGLYGLGLIYANYLWDQSVLNKVTEVLVVDSNSHVVKHGACLSIGLIAMGSQEERYYELVLKVLKCDNPESGEAAGYAIGMIMLGAGPCRQSDTLLEVCAKTEHEKIIRGCAMGLALMMYGKENGCESVVEKLLQSGVALMRESAAWVTALAYVGTASNIALKRLLHLAVSDVNNDVRRAAVIGIGFVLSRAREQVPGMVHLLAESYHPYVRAGAALALGISCAGTGMQEAIDILIPLLEADHEDFVRQSAMISMAMVLQQQSDTAVPYAKKFRDDIRKMMAGKRKGLSADLEAFSVCLAWGILNAGGNNVVISCNSLNGDNSAPSTVGLALFCNYFYWIPLSLMLCLSFHPTAVIGLGKDLEVVSDWKILSKGSAKLYAYPPSFQSEIDNPKSRPYAVMSIARPEKAQMESEPKEEVEEETDIEEITGVQLSNPARVTLNQLSVIDFHISRKYRPITGTISHGLVMLKEVDEDED